ncbi:LysM peptidoglycan-binding domain-containing M23 family metallopeptidase [Roseovarius aestuariivivens]|uniref:LysM peptidoglycan-binding domain-containing M23 family metallopeptidase n=1 Tax=Roseovarius aestuariivivens TaxID=1888910 RepID=UPI00108025A0|nr:LysM peptidoglycan-binding domain-containing M23 family metallopeptidase [Roseovarius aestuariivivens]
MSFSRRMGRGLVVVAGAVLLQGCSDDMDFDMRGAFGNAPSTAEAARNAAAARPDPDSRGIISYPNYQVAVARRGDTLSTLAARIGADVTALARYNGMQPGDPLRPGEVIALPGRVAEPAGGPIRPGAVDISSIAGQAIDAADAERAGRGAAPRLNPGQSGVEPVRHRVERGETAFTIARLYDVSVRSLADWNGLGPDFAVREGQYLLIPVVLAEPARRASPAAVQTTALETEPPGAGTPTPTPPSASQPLPNEETVPAAEPVKATAAPDLGGTKPATNTQARMDFPVRGDIIREYAKGKNDGIDIAASPGTPVRAAAAGTVAAITEDTNGVPIIVVKHEANLLTVYSNVANLAVEKGDRIDRGGKLAEIRRDGTAAVHFEVREGFDSVDPMPYLR